MKNKMKFTFAIALMIGAFAACNSSTSETSGATQEDSIVNDNAVIIPSDTIAAEPQKDSSATETR